MGREIRRVLPHWKHPKETKLDRFGNPREVFTPLYDESYEEAIEKWIKGREEWKISPKEGYEEYSCEDYHGWAPRPNEYRPSWKEEEATWYQVYETVSEGTPVTPPFGTKEEVVEYLVQHGDFLDQRRRRKGGSVMPCDPWSREAAEQFVSSGWAPSMMVDTSKGVIETPGHVEKL